MYNLLYICMPDPDHILTAGGESATPSGNYICVLQWGILGGLLTPLQKYFK